MTYLHADRRAGISVKENLITMNKSTRKSSTIKNSQDKLSWSGYMATLSTAILAVASIFTAFIAYSTWRHVQESSRPYFSVKELSELETPLDKSLSMHLINAGDHPAEALKNRITITLAETGQTIYEQENNILSTIPRETETTVLLDLSGWREGGESPFAHELYLALWLSYYDPLLQQNYIQDIFLKCNGLVEDEYVELTWMTQEEQKLLNAIRHSHR